MLLGAVTLLVAGETILKRFLDGMVFLVYWLVCFLCTGLAILTAYLDARALQSKGRKEARELLENTLSKIQDDAQKKPLPNKQNRLN